MADKSITAPGVEIFPVELTAVESRDINAPTKLDEMRQATREDVSKMKDRVKNEIAELKKLDKSSPEYKKGIMVLREFVSAIDSITLEYRTQVSQATDTTMVHGDNLKGWVEISQEIRTGLKDLSTSVMKVSAENTRQEQANALISNLEKAADGNPALAEWINDYLKPTRDSNGRENSPRCNLSDVNLPSLADHLLHEVPYRSDGAYGVKVFGWRIGSEPAAVQAMTEIYEKHKAVIAPVLNNILLANQTGSTAEAVNNATGLQDGENIKDYLVKNEDIKNAASTQATMKIAKEILSNIPDKDMAKAMKRALELGEYSGAIPSDEAGLKKLLSENPSAKFAILAGIQRSARYGNGAPTLVAEKTLRISKDRRDVLDELNTEKGKEVFKNGMESLFANTESDIDKNEQLSPEQKEKFKKSIAEYKEALKDQKTFDLQYQGFAAAVTNVGAGAGAAWGTNLNSFFADSASLSLGLSTGDKPVGIGLTFTKNISKNTTFLYGFAGKPFAGVAHRFDSGYDVMLVGNPGGFSVTMSQDSHINREVRNKTMELGTNEDILKSITEYSSNLNTKISEVAFGAKLPEGYEIGDGAHKLDQKSYDAINKSISKSVQNYLSLSTFESEKNPLVRESMIKEALRRAIQDRVDAANFDVNSGGWNLDKIGVTLGMFAGATFILPHVSFSKTDLKITMKTKGEMKAAKKKDATPAVAGIENQEAIGEDLKSTVSGELAKIEVRKQLSRLWVRGSLRRPKVEAFALALNEMQNSTASDSTLVSARKAFLESIKGLGVMKNLRTAIGKIQDPTELQAALYDLRGAMMMDVRQSESLNTKALGKGTYEINKSTAAVEQDFNALLEKSRMKTLLDTMGLTKEDYAGVIRGDAGKAYQIGAVMPKTIGAVASLKTDAKYMAHMPAGTMRFAQAGGQEFAKDATGFSAEKKNKMFSVLVPEGGRTAAIMVASITKNLKLDASKCVSYENLRELAVTGKTDIGGTKVEMNGQKFLLCAYGDCTNPGIALTLGKVSIAGKPGSEAEVETEELAGTRIDIAPDDDSATFAAGYVNAPTETRVVTEEKREPAIITTPGENRVGPINVNGQQVGLVNANGTITVGTGTFRLAPGQTIDQFLNGRGLVNDRITLISHTSTAITSYDKPQFLQYITRIIAEPEYDALLQKEIERGERPFDS